MNGVLETSWSADEVFAAALLHDLGVALLAGVSPESFQRVYGSADRFKISICEAFQKIYSRSLDELAAVAMEAWGLPPVFAQTTRFQSQPWSLPAEFDALACINYGDYLVSVHGCTLEKWIVEPPLEWEVQSAVGLTDQEAAQLLHKVTEQAFDDVDQGQLKAA